MYGRATMDAQIVYFYRGKSSPGDKSWTHAALPMITNEFQTFRQNIYEVMKRNIGKVIIEFLRYLGRLCAEDGAMNGWSVKQFMLNPI